MAILRFALCERNGGNRLSGGDISDAVGLVKEEAGIITPMERGVERGPSVAFDDHAD